MKKLFVRYKKGFYLLIAVFTVLLVIFVFRVFQSVEEVKNTVNTIQHELMAEKNNISGWDDSKANELNKQISWLEQHLAVSKSDSITLGINLKDSIVQVQLKGTVLFQTKILKQKPEQFLNNTSKTGYYSLFGKPSQIKSEFSSIPKKPFKKVKPRIAGEEPSETVIADTIKPERFFWQFETSSRLTFVIHGAQLDNDTIYFIPAKKDVFDYRIKQTLQQKKNKAYSQTVFLWMNDAEVRAIYRALPENAKVIIRN